MDNGPNIKVANPDSPPYVCAKFQTSPMKKTILIPALLLSAALISSCGGGHKNPFEALADSLKKQKEAQLTGPITDIDFSRQDDASLDGKRISISGYVMLPSSFFTMGEHLNIDLYQRKNQDHSGAFTLYMSIPIGSEKNTIKKLPKEYTSDDFRIHGNSGEDIHAGDYIKVVGVYKKSFGSSKMASIDIQTIEKATEPAPTNYEALGAVKVDAESAKDTTLENKLAYAEGTLELPMYISPSSGSIYLYLNQGGDEQMSIDVLLGDGPGQVEMPPSDFTQDDLKVYDKSGALIPAGKKVRVYGMLKYGRLQAEQFVVQ